MKIKSIFGLGNKSNEVDESNNRARRSSTVTTQVSDDISSDLVSSKNKAISKLLDLFKEQGHRTELLDYVTEILNNPKKQNISSLVYNYLFKTIPEAEKQIVRTIFKAVRLFLKDIAEKAQSGSLEELTPAVNAFFEVMKDDDKRKILVDFAKEFTTHEKLKKALEKSPTADISNYIALVSDIMKTDLANNILQNPNGAEIVGKILPFIAEYLKAKKELSNIPSPVSPEKLTETSQKLNARIPEIASSSAEFLVNALPEIKEDIIKLIKDEEFIKHILKEKEKPGSGLIKPQLALNKETLEKVLPLIDKDLIKAGIDALQKLDSTQLGVRSELLEQIKTLAPVVGTIASHDKFQPLLKTIIDQNELNPLLDYLKSDGTKLPEEIIKHAIPLVNKDTINAAIGLIDENTVNPSMIEKITRAFPAIGTFDQLLVTISEQAKEIHNKGTLQEKLLCLAEPNIVNAAIDLINKKTLITFFPDNLQTDTQEQTKIPFTQEDVKKLIDATREVIKDKSDEKIYDTLLNELENFSSILPSDNNNSPPPEKKNSLSTETQTLLKQASFSFLQKVTSTPAIADHFSNKKDEIANAVDYLANTEKGALLKTLGINGKDISHIAEKSLKKLQNTKAQKALAKCIENPNSLTAKLNLVYHSGVLLDCLKLGVKACKNYLGTKLGTFVSKLRLSRKADKDQQITKS